MRTKPLYFIIVFATILFSLDCSKTKMQNSSAITVPVLATANATVHVTQSTAISGGLITLDEGAVVTARGVC